MTRWISMAAVGLLAVATTAAATAALATGHEQLPGTWREVRRQVEGQRADVWLDLPAGWFGPQGLDELHLEALQRRYLAVIGEPPEQSLPVHAPWLGAGYVLESQQQPGDLDRPPALPDQVRHVELWGRLPQRVSRLAVRPGQWTRLVQLVADPEPVPRRPWEKPLPAAPVASTLDGDTLPTQGKGFLSGKTVYLSPGHGFTWTQNLNRWATQRGNTHNLVEDLLNAEAAFHYLVPMLRNAGAQVVTMRERDLNSAEAVVDDASAKAANGSGYSEISGNWQAGTIPGFAAKATVQGSDNPFVLGSYRAAKATAGVATAAAQFVPSVPTTGRYAVYVTWTASANRVPDAHYEVRHLGGSSHVRLDQTKHGGTWAWLGYFSFAAGVDPSKGSIVLHNDTLSGLADRYVIADAVRFGGGMGSVERGTGKPPAAGPNSGRPRWEESCRTYAQFSGAPSSVWDYSSDDPSDDVSCRSRMAAWHHEEGEDAIFLSWHTNAPSPARGTSTYVYGPNAPDGSYDFTGTKGSDAFGKLVQKVMVADIKALWDPAWKDRGVYTAYFGEINPKHNNEMPSALVEAAFHSTKEDADQLREPRFRHLLARSLYKAIAQYFADRDKVPLQLLPEPPQAVQMVRTAAGTAQVQWQPGPTGSVYGQAPTSYLVQLSKDGLGFDEGTPATGTSVVVPLPAGAQPLFARVVAINLGGASLPSAVVGAVEGCAGAPRALAVQGFTRLDSALAPVDDLSAYSLASVQRLRQSKMNTYDYLVAHVQGLAAAGLGVDSAERLAVTPALLAGHALVDWAAGENSSIEGIFDAAAKQAMTDWLQGGSGRSWWLNGAEVLWTLEAKGGPAGGDWLETWFGARYGSDDAGIYTVQGAAGIAGSWNFDDGTGAAYHVDFPDVLLPKASATILNYASGKGVAATLNQLPNKSNALLLGVPLETVYPLPARQELFAKLVAASLPTTTCPGGTGADAGSTDAAADVGLPDAGGDDAGPADGAESDSTGGSDGTQDDAAGVDGAGPDAGSGDGAPADSPGADVAPGDLATVDAAADSVAKPLPVAPAPVDDGCQAARRSGHGDAAVLLGLLALGTLQARRRRVGAWPCG